MEECIGKKKHFINRKVNRKDGGENFEALIAVCISISYTLFVVRYNDGSASSMS